MDAFNRDPRLWAIAMNSIREAKIAYGRADDPFSDDDSARMTAIFDLLHVQEKIDHSIEHFPLASKNEKVSEKVAKVTSLLKALPEEIRTTEEEIAQALNINVPKASKTA